MDISDYFLSSSDDLFGIVLVGLACYVSLVVMLRISGKRTLSKMNMFDWIITVAMGSIMASAVVSKSTTYLDAIVAFATLIAAQFIVTWLSVRSDVFADIVKADPTILYYKGRFFEDAMRTERVPKNEILSAIRQSGQGAPAEIAAVILESNGELIVMNKVESDQTVTLQQAGNWDRAKSIV